MSLVMTSRSKSGSSLRHSEDSGLSEDEDSSYPSSSCPPHAWQSVSKAVGSPWQSVRKTVSSPWQSVSKTGSSQQGSQQAARPIRAPSPNIAQHKHSGLSVPPP